MASSSVSPMLLFVLLLLVSPHMDQVFGSQIESRKLEETNNGDQVVTPQGFLPSGFGHYVSDGFRRYARYLGLTHGPYVQPKLPNSPKAVKVIKNFTKFVKVFKPIIKEVLSNNEKVDFENTNTLDECQKKPGNCPEPFYALICDVYRVEYNKSTCPPRKFVKAVKQCLKLYAAKRKCPTYKP